MFYRLGHTAPRWVYFCLLMITIVCPIDWGMILTSWRSNKLQKGGAVTKNLCYTYRLYKSTIRWIPLRHLRHMNRYIKGTLCELWIFSVFAFLHQVHPLLTIWNGPSEFFRCMFSLWYNDEIGISHSKVFKQSKEGEYRYQKSYKQKISRCLLFYIWVRLPSVLSIKIKQLEKGMNWIKKNL